MCVCMYVCMCVWENEKWWVMAWVAMGFGCFRAWTALSLSLSPLSLSLSLAVPRAHHDGNSWPWPRLMANHPYHLSLSLSLCVWKREKRERENESRDGWWIWRLLPCVNFFVLSCLKQNRLVAPKLSEAMVEPGTIDCSLSWCLVFFLKKKC